jgi:hypothetical protein
VSTIGNIVAAGGEAAEDLVVKVESQVAKHRVSRVVPPAERRKGRRRSASAASWRVPGDASVTDLSKQAGAVD